MTKKHWNYRVLRTDDVLGQDTETTYAIHEVYYGDDGEPEMWSTEPIPSMGSSLQELKDDLLAMAAASSKPVLVITETEPPHAARVGAVLRLVEES